MTRTQETLYVDLRWMIRRDLPSVLQIERNSFPNPWLEDDMLDVLKRSNCIGMVAEHDNRVVGFMIYELFKTRLELMDLAVAPEYRRRHIGTQLMDKLKNKLSIQCRSTIAVNVRETNLAAQCFFRDRGFFSPVGGVIREHFEDTGEDAYRMFFAVDID